MAAAMESSTFIVIIEYVAIFCCGMVGGLSAVRKHYDITAILITAWLTAMGGGIIRDVMLDVTPVGVSDRGYVLTALASGVAVAVIHPEVDRLKWSMLTLDALAVALFAVNGTSKAMGLGTSGMTAVFMGMFTALGGGLVRDMLINEVPMIIRDKHWYFVPSAVGCVLTVFVCKARASRLIGFEWEMVLDIAIVVIVVVMRLLSIKFDIAVPGAVERHHTYLPSESRYLRRPVIHPNVDADTDEHAADRGKPTRSRG